MSVDALDIPQGPSFELLKTSTVYNVANMLFSAGSIGVDVLLHIVVGIENDFDNTVFVHPLDEIFLKVFFW